MKLENLLRKALVCGRRGARAHLAAGKVLVNGAAEAEGARLIGIFDRVEFDGTVLQARVARYLALHKPSGYVSATVDPGHPTVIDLIDAPWASGLHLAGRLDRFTTGLVILTNDTRFSEALTEPGRKVPKVYLVDTDAPIPEEAVVTFRKGMRFEKENIRTQPAIVEPLDECRCRLTIYEGKHHQVKRMFARFGIKVVGLHRESVGAISLDDLGEGEWREFVVELGRALPGKPGRDAESEGEDEV